jgi:capsular polysaccharide biosynthesis protein
VYDTLPYLITYNQLKGKINNLKLLMNYPNYESTKLYPFVKEFLEILDIKDGDIIIAKDNVLYKSVYISSSFTHGIDSNLPPRKEVYDFYKKIVNIVNSKYDDNKIYPSKIYISRRSWIHNDMSNIGTNYTSKRKLVNEDELVDLLNLNGYEEVFTENLSTIKKIQMFSKAEIVIGAIGGGLCNVLFSNENTNLIALISPTFLDVNNRFLYSFSKVKTTLFNDASHLEKSDWKKYMRVKTNTGIVGEIEDIIDDKLKIIYTDKKIAGWNSQLNLNNIIVDMIDCEKLDDGLNSPWLINIKKLKYEI